MDAKGQTLYEKMVEGRFFLGNGSCFIEFRQIVWHKGYNVFTQFPGMCRGETGVHCPTCAKAFHHCYNPQQGSHVAYHCSCGQLLQWDYPIISPQPSAYIIGSPTRCMHPEQHTPDALFPLLSM